MKLEELLADCEVLDSKVSASEEVALISANSSKLVPGGVFFAISGHSVDGHRFVESALSAGSVAVVVEREAVFKQFPHTIWVKSTRAALAKCASLWFGRPSTKLNLVGVTGTNGKSTTSYLLKNIWDRIGYNSGLIGTVEYWIGSRREPSKLTTPAPMDFQSMLGQMVAEGVSYAACEASSIALDQCRVLGTRFSVGVFTNLTQDHLDYHPDLEQYYLAKRRLFFDHSMDKAVINIDDPYGSRLAREYPREKLVSFSTSGQADFIANQTKHTASGSESILTTPVGEKKLKTSLIGHHNVQNVLGAVATCHSLGMDLDRVPEAIVGAKGAPGRLEKVMERKDLPSVFVDYAHTPDALVNVLNILGELRSCTSEGRLITVFGCGGDRDRKKRALMANAASHASEITIATSDNPRTEDPESIIDDIETGVLKSKTHYLREVDRRKAIHLALSLAEPKDFVLIAGKGHEDYQIIGAKKRPFDDCQVVREYYNTF